MYGRRPYLIRITRAVINMYNACNHRFLVGNAHLVILDFECLNNVHSCVINVFLCIHVSDLMFGPRTCLLPVSLSCICEVCHHVAFRGVRSQWLSSLLATSQYNLGLSYIFSSAIPDRLMYSWRSLFLVPS